MSKFNNKKTIIDGISFDSRKEAKYYTVLKNDENIHNLKLQVRFELLPKQVDSNGKCVHRAVYYVADFVYDDENGVEHIVDTKGMKTDVFKLKAKLFYYKYGRDIEII